MFLPAVRPLLTLAAELEEQRNHVVKLPAGKGLDELQYERVESELGAPDFIALDSEAEFAHVLHGGRAHTAGSHAASLELAEEEEEYLGLPGLQARLRFTLRVGAP